MDASQILVRVQLRDLVERTDFIAAMSRHDINRVFHYVPFHSSPAGIRYGRAHRSFDISNMQSERLVRLPMFFELSGGIRSQ
jgi:dTDP-4-amino-4,6-dideoxygalactose transaminase